MVPSFVEFIKIQFFFQKLYILASKGFLTKDYSQCNFMNMNHEFDEFTQKQKMSDLTRSGFINNVTSHGNML